MAYMEQMQSAVGYLASAGEAGRKSLDGVIGPVNGAISLGLSAPSATTDRIPSTTWTRLTGRPQAMASTFRSKTTSAWLILCGAAKAR